MHHVQPTQQKSGLFGSTPSRAYEIERYDILDLGIRLHDTNSTYAISMAFIKAKASANYNILETIQYRIILPLKELIVGLTNVQKTDLDLYEKHTALCSGIQKVQDAYKSYIAAQKAADQAPTEPELARKEARLHAIAKGNSLVEGYRLLIKLAIDQAAEIGVNKTGYLEDLNRELDKDFHISHTVNTIRIKDIEADWLEYENVGFLKEEYLKFVTEFVSNVREARLQLGNNSVFDDDDIEYISDAYIQGLADIPELGELEGGLVLTQVYDQLTAMQQESAVADAQNQVIRHFITQIEKLMQRPYRMTTADLEAIHYKGIPLLSVMKTLNAHDLNRLKDFGDGLRAQKKTFQDTEAGIKVEQQRIAESSEYTFKEVQQFLGKGSIESIPNDGNALGLLAKSYTEALKIYNGLTKQIKEATERQGQEKTDRTDQINTNKALLDAIEEQIAGLQQDIVAAHAKIDTKQNELNEFSQGVAAEMEKMVGEKEGSNQIQKSLKEMKITGFKRGSDDAVKTREQEIVKLKDELQDMQRAYSTQQIKVTELGNAQVQLTEVDEERDEQDAKALKALRIQLEVLETKSIAELTGEDLKALRTHLKMNGITIIGNKISERLGVVDKAEAEIEQLNRVLSQCPIEGLEKAMKDLVPSLSLNDEQAFVLDAAIFSDEAKADIAARLKSNLVIAKKVTIAVGRKVENQDVAFLIEKQEKDTKSSHKSKRAYANVEPKLKSALDAREEEVKNVNLVQLVRDGMEKLKQKNFNHFGLIYW